VGGRITTFPNFLPYAFIALFIGGRKPWAPSMITALMALQPSSTARFTSPTA
jgi:hypothetical protein